MFAGTKALVGLILRRDRIKLPVWIVGIVASLLSVVPVLRETYGDQASWTALYQSLSSNAAGLFLTGPMDSATFGGVVTIETLLWWGLAVAFMNTLLIVRHTRLNEEMGAQELLLAGQVHRGAGLLSALSVAFVADMAIAVGIGAGLALMEPTWGAGAWLYGLAIGIFGFVWAVIAGIVVQLVESARSANGMLAGLIGIAFAIRGVGDFMSNIGADGLLQPAWMSWFSPFGWMQATRGLTAPEWWPLAIPVVFVVVAIPVAFWLLSKRDVGAGILPARKGRARASAFLQTPLGLTWKLQKNIFVGWMAGSLATVMTISVLLPEMSHVYESSESTRALIEAMGGTGAMIPAFLSVMLAIIAVMVLAYVVQGLSKLSSEESSGHLENLLVLRLARVKWLSLHTLVVLVGGAIMLMISGATLAIAVNTGTDTTASVWSYIIAGLSYFPVLLLFAGLYIVLFGLLPRVVGVVVWVLFGYVAFMSWLGPLFKLEQWIMDLSPLSHVAPAPAQDIVLGPLVVMTCIALILLTIGIAAFRVRDVQTS